MIWLLAHGGHEHAEPIATSLPIVAGVIAGAAHVFLGPDHLAAVAPLASERTRRPWLGGVLWGLGHSGGVWLLALLALVFREALPLDWLSAWSERLVGVVLIGVGLWGLRRVLRLHVHSHVHTHAGPDGAEHSHEHVHVHAVAVPDAGHEHSGERDRHGHGHGMLGIGALHGIAGTAHLLGVLPALAMPDRASAVAYVVSFGVGSIAGMGVFTTGLGMLVRATDHAGRGLSRGVMMLSSVAAVLVGGFWLIGALG